MSTSLHEAIERQAQARQELAASLARISGGRDLVEWFEGEPEFGDAEVVSLLLDRSGPSRLQLKVEWRDKRAQVAFELAAWIDVDLRGFSQQNVIDGMILRPAGDREEKAWEVGVGCQPGGWLIEFGPCFGAYGAIRADITRISIA